MTGQERRASGGVAEIMIPRAPLGGAGWLWPARCRVGRDSCQLLCVNGSKCSVCDAAGTEVPGRENERQEEMLGRLEVVFSLPLVPELRGRAGNIADMENCGAQRPSSPVTRKGRWFEEVMRVDGLKLFCGAEQPRSPQQPGWRATSRRQIMFEYLDWARGGDCAVLLWIWNSLYIIKEWERGRRSRVRHRLLIPNQGRGSSTGLLA